jgi:photosystem II stability/assembly factor-like uncharacterized protein
MKKFITVSLLAFFLCITGFAQSVPELMYYKFENNGTGVTPNYASSPVGTNPAPLGGVASSFSNQGQFDSCLLGSSTPQLANTGGLNTGWLTSMPANWTISFWLGPNIIDGNPSYIFGDPGAGSFRCFYGGAALPNNILLRGFGTDILITGVGTTATVLHITYNGTNVIVYKNGVVFGTFPRTASPTGGTGFRVGSYNTALVSQLCGRLDEFRMYNRALDQAEITATWNIELGGVVNCNYSWVPQTSGVTGTFYSVKAINDQVCWAVGAAAMVRRTTDGGTTWTNGNPNPGVITGDIYNIEAIDANTAWCTTSPSTTNIYKTTNGGVNWVNVYNATGFINAIKMTSSSNGIATGDPVAGNWVILGTTNGGVNWASISTTPGTGDGRNNCLRVVGSNVWFGSGQGTVWRSTNGGVAWTFAPTAPLTTQVLGLHFNNATTGLASGSSMVRTTDGGLTWGAVTIAGTGNVSGIVGTGTDYWAVRGTGIYRSTDNGVTWASVHTAVGTQNDISLASGSNGCLVAWSVATGGNIAKMNGVPVGIENPNSQIPNVYALEQNYPNPFNPTTSISFSLPKAGVVELKVYDILGKEVATLVNGFNQAGSHTVNFDASALSSGIYFYTLKSADFTDTKKMVLVK